MPPTGRSRAWPKRVTYLEIDRQPFIDSMKGFSKISMARECRRGFLDAVESVRQS
ncbi:MAG: hypothetical protein R3D03_11225 [Geminicoccaceae bacterium]